MKFTLKLTGKNPEELASLFNALSDAGVLSALPVSVNHNATEATLDVEDQSPKRGRGRPRKSDGTGLDNPTDGPVLARPDGTAAGTTNFGHTGPGAEPGNASGNPILHGDGDAGLRTETDSGGPGHVSGSEKNNGATPRADADHSTVGTTATTATTAAAESAAALDAGTKGTPDVTNTVVQATSTANAPVTLTAQQAVEQGVALMIVAFGQSPKDMGPIQRLQQKYAVRMFKDVPEARAFEFLADAKLIASGSPVV